MESENKNRQEEANLNKLHPLSHNIIVIYPFIPDEK